MRRAVPLLVSLCLVLSACTADGEESATSETSPSPSESTSPSPSSESSPSGESSPSSESSPSPPSTSSDGAAEPSPQDPADGAPLLAGPATLGPGKHDILEGTSFGQVQVDVTCEGTEDAQVLLGSEPLNCPDAETISFMVDATPGDASLIVVVPEGSKVSYAVSARAAEELLDPEEEFLSGLSGEFDEREASPTSFSSQSGPTVRFAAQCSGTGQIEVVLLGKDHETVGTPRTIPCNTGRHDFTLRAPGKATGYRVNTPAGQGSFDVAVLSAS